MSESDSLSFSCNSPSLTISRKRALLFSRSLLSCELSSVIFSWSIPRICNTSLVSLFWVFLMKNINSLRFCSWMANFEPNSLFDLSYAISFVSSEYILFWKSSNNWLDFVYYHELHLKCLSFVLPFLIQRAFLNFASPPMWGIFRAFAPAPTIGTQCPCIGVPQLFAILLYALVARSVWSLSPKLPRSATPLLLDL